MATASVLVDKAIGKAGRLRQRFGDADDRHRASMAPISNSRRATYGYDQRIEVHGSKGMVMAENQRPVSIELANAGGYTRPPLHDFFMTRYTEAYAAEISAFIDVVMKNKAPSPSGTDGMLALALADAAVKSVEKKKAVEVGLSNHAGARIIRRAGDFPSRRRRGESAACVTPSASISAGTGSCRASADATRAIAGAVCMP